MILRLIFNYAGIFYVYVIYKKLSPIYYICLHRLNVLILNILHFINNLIYNDISTLSQPGEGVYIITSPYLSAGIPVVDELKVLRE